MFCISRVLTNYLSLTFHAYISLSFFINFMVQSNWDTSLKTGLGIPIFFSSLSLYLGWFFFSSSHIEKSKINVFHQGPVKKRLFLRFSSLNINYLWTSVVYICLVDFYFSYLYTYNILWLILSFLGQEATSICMCCLGFSSQK